MSWVPSVTLVSGLDEAKGSREGQDFPGTGGRQDAKFQRQRPLGRLSPTCPRASFIFPCQAVTEGASKRDSLQVGRAPPSHSYFRKACSRACRSSFALACRSLSGYFCK
jgi:hypothetical protein